MELDHQILIKKIMQHYIYKEAKMKNKKYKYYTYYEEDNNNLNNFEFISSFDAIVIKSKLPAHDIKIIMSILHGIYHDNYWIFYSDFDTKRFLKIFNRIYGYELKDVDIISDWMVTNYNHSNCVKFWINIIDLYKSRIINYDDQPNTPQFIRQCYISVKNKRFLEFTRDDKPHEHSFEQVVLNLTDINKDFIDNLEIIITKH